MTVNIDDSKIAVIGLGYVGLPLAIEFSKKYQVIGYDTMSSRVEQLNNNIDFTLEANKVDLSLVTSSKHKEKKLGLTLVQKENELEGCNIFIIAVPTPINRFKAPDLTYLREASKTVGRLLKPGNIVIYESTVYPGCTEEECIPILEYTSKLVFNRDFYVGYSPERINPGDKVNTLTKIIKVTSGSTPEIADFVDNLYQTIISAGTHKAPSIKVAEASKAIENAQRDLNISFVNELALIFDRIGIDTNDVIDAAATKWNFLMFRPGLVGGHCIGVDPYYLAFKAESLGYYPNVILSGRKVNDDMGSFVANKVIRLLIEKDHKVKGANVLIMGITFKENCPDVRNTRVIDIYNELCSIGLIVDVYDPWANKSEVLKDYCINIIDQLPTNKKYDAVIVTVAHGEFLQFDFSKIKNDNTVIFDAKGFIDRKLVNGRL